MAGIEFVLEGYVKTSQLSALGFFTWLSFDKCDKFHLLQIYTSISGNVTYIYRSQEGPTVVSGEHNTQIDRIEIRLYGPPNTLLGIIK